MAESFFALSDGDYDEKNSEAAEAFEELLDKKVEKYDDVDEYVINNIWEVVVEGRDTHLEILYSYTDDDSWSGSLKVSLTPEEIEIVRQAVPDPGNGPYFRIEE